MSLSALNARISTPRSPIGVGLAVFLLASAAFLTRAGLQIGFDAVPGPGDEADYDLLAQEIAAGRGFRFDYDNADWRAPYEEANRNGDAAGAYNVILNRHGAAATTYRPPLFPTVMAGLYSVFGQSFAAARFFNCLTMAAAGGIAAWIVARRLGVLPGLLCGFLFAVIEHRARYHAGLVLTESLASLFAVLLAASLIALSESGRWRTVLAAGLIAGLGILNRPLVVLWIPIVALLISWVAPRRKLLLATVFLLVTAAVVAPWSVRNSLLLGRFSPLGTHGQQNLAAAYSDEAVRQGGVWYRLDATEFFPASIDDSRPGIDRELARAELSQRTAFEWMRQNPLKVPALAALRVWQLWQPRMHWDALVLGLAAFGLVLWPVAAERRLLGGLLLANTLAVAATWSVAGRFLVPLLPVLHVAAACGAWIVLLAVTERRKTVRDWLGKRTTSDRPG